MNTRLGGGVIDLTVLTGLTIDRTDIDHTTKTVGAHVVNGQTAHVETRGQIGVNHVFPHLRCHTVQSGVAGNPGIIDHNANMAELLVDFLDCGFTFFKFADIPAFCVNTCFGGEGLSGFFVTGIIGNDRITGIFQGFRNAAANATSPTSYNCYTSHIFLQFICLNKIPP